MFLGVNPFYLMSTFYLTGAVGVFTLIILSNLDISPAVNGASWLRIHIIAVGAVTQALFGVITTLAAERFGVSGQPSRASWRQWALLNTGFFLLLLGMPSGHGLTNVAGGILVFLAVLSLGNNLYLMARRSREAAGPGALFFVTAPWFLLVGITLALSIFMGWPAPGGYAGIRESHIHANVWGFLSLAAAGTVLDLIPVLTGRKPARPGWVPAIYWLMTTGAVLLVAGPWLGLMPLMMAGMLPFMAATLLLLGNLYLSHDRSGPMPVRTRHLIAAYFWVFAPILAAPVMHMAPTSVSIAAVESAALQGLIFGWALQLLLAVLPVFLGRSLQRGKVLSAGAGNLPDASRWGLGLLNAGPVAIWAGTLVGQTAPWGDLVLSAGYALIAGAILITLGRTWSWVNTVESTSTPNNPEAATQ